MLGCARECQYVNSSHPPLLCNCAIAFITIDGLRCGLLVTASSDSGPFFSVSGIFVGSSDTFSMSLLLLLTDADPCDNTCCRMTSFCDDAARNAASLFLAVVGTCVLVPAVVTDAVTGRGTGSDVICGSSAVGISSVASVV